MARSHRMTPARRAALRKAQAASARKRRGRGKGKLASSNRRYDSFKSTTRNVLIAAAAVGGAAALGHAAYRSRSGKPKVAPAKQQTIRDAVSHAHRSARRRQAPGLQLASRYRGSRARYQGFYRL